MSNEQLDNSYALANTGEHAAPPASLPFDFDPAKYRAEVDRFDITDEQKQELLLTLWSIMRSFVELGFSVDVCAGLANGFTAVSSDKDLA